MGGILGSLIGAGGSILGSLLGGSQQSAGDVFKSAFKAKMKMGEKYGISKLVMAGAPAGASPWESTGSGLGEALGSMGQDIGRAIATRQTAPERVATRLALEGQGLDNELKRAQIRSMNSRTIRESAPPAPNPLLKAEKPQWTTDTPFGDSVWKNNPNYPDAQWADNVFGDDNPIGAVMKMVIGDAHVSHNLRRGGYPGSPSELGVQINQYVRDLLARSGGVPAYPSDYLYYPLP